MSESSPEKAKIFAAHIEILMDEEVQEGVKEMIFDSHTMPDYAVDEIYTSFAGLLEKASPLTAGLPT